ncbi:MAG TPA: M23 family metallopeptidase [Geminicoccus sp.]|jgi:murein DD-endopeptidase MepM/ murein hydrolase activator NlpD|uniref:M23 family metallopeptidase n=1 Tax=Geminicoccus sp. TaxID=2024832 RepID=UPI002E3255F5|nr:M23 family metallopeptidase [Geminicoccus sp.]HEX2528739.1 M23 family metallopeptidase [Geminicoccus sp.]
MIRRLLALCLLAPLPASAFELGFPVACTPGTDCWIIHYVDHDRGPGIADSFCGPMTYDGHDGTDIGLRDEAAMRAGVEVVASAPGVVKAVRDGVPDVTVEEGGLEAVKGIDCGNGVVLQHDEGWETQYCHMRKGSIAVRPGDSVAAGDRLGLVGLSGMTSFPHLHLTVRRDGNELDPFHGTGLADACSAAGSPLWRPELAAALTYQPLAMPVLGVADGPVSGEAVWEGDAAAARLSAGSPALVVFMGAYALRENDRIELSLVSPDGQVVADRQEIQERDQARTMRFAGRKRPPEGWLPGSWKARAAVTRNGKTYVQVQGFEVLP